MRLAPLLKGLSTYLPGLSNGISKKGESAEGTGSARYCYSVWLRHLVMAHENRLPTQFDTIAELGPGSSLGVGLAALLSGVSRHYSLDVVEYATNQRNIQIFDELVELYQKRTGIPGPSEFPQAKPLLSSYDFPSSILTEERLNQAFAPSRIQSLRDSLSALNRGLAGSAQIFYFVPWFDSEVIQEGSVDMVYSQAALEHVDDLDATYEALARWLKPRGFLSCQVDFKCHETAAEWNGHWAYSDFVWRLIRGRRPYLLNREPHSRHLQLLKKYGFEIVCDVHVKTPSEIQRHQLAPRFRDISEEDLAISGAFIQAVKKN